MLEIVKDLGTRPCGKRTRHYVLVKCPICGDIYELDYYNAKRTTLCKKCKQKELNGKRKKFKNSAERKLYINYKNSAKSRGLNFDLTQKQFADIIYKECHYCGIKHYTHLETYGDIIDCNGIDRIDSSIGYNVYNCVPCCTICNFGKNDMTYEDFISYLKRVTNKWR